MSKGVNVFIYFLENYRNEEELHKFHQTLTFRYGRLEEELPEQMMAATYIKPNNVVLELCGNIGRNSIVIASLLHNQQNLVVMECAQHVANQLEENRNMNHFTFHIEVSALSSQKLIQKIEEDTTGVSTIPSDKLLDGYRWVNTISFSDLEKKYNKTFDTLVADCEGALYYILQDFPTMLHNIKTIIMENDYLDINQKLKVDEIIKKMVLNVFL